MSKFEYRFSINNRQKLSVSVFAGPKGPVLNLRKFYQDDDEWKPDRQGLTLDMELATKLTKAIKLLNTVKDDAPEPEWSKSKSKGKKEKDTKKNKSKSRRNKDDEDDDD